MNFEVDLADLIEIFKVKFPSDKECNDFLYTSLKASKTLNLFQCKCTNRNIRSFYKKYHYWLRGKKYLTGGSARPAPISEAGITRVSNILYPLPDRLGKVAAENGVFAECKFCHTKYYITSGTVFHTNSSPLKSQMALFLIAEYYKFDSEHDTKIMSAFRQLRQHPDLIQSSRSFKASDEFSYNDKSLYRYRDLFTRKESLINFKNYTIINFLKT